jgi:hypothetical protein
VSDKPTAGKTTSPTNDLRSVDAFLIHKHALATYYGKLHYHCADYFAKRNRNSYSISISTTIIALYLSNSKVAEATIVSMLVWLGRSSQGSLAGAQFIIGVLGLVAVLVFCWQLFSRYEERQAAHRLFSSEFFSLARQIEAKSVSGQVSEITALEIDQALELTMRHAPTISGKFWDLEGEMQNEMVMAHKELKKLLARAQTTNKPQSGSTVPAPTP